MNSSRFSIAKVLAACIFFSIPPFFLWNSKLVALFNVFAGLSCLFLIKKSSVKEDNPPIFASFLLGLSYVWLCTISNANIFGVITTLAIVPLFFMPGRSINAVYDCFKKIMAALLGLSLVVYVFVVFLGIDLPHTTIEPLNEFKIDVYYQYYFLVKKADILSGFRFYGLFDEPGVIGTIASVVLLIEGFNIKKWYNCIFIISGILSFSLAFYLVAIAYLLIVLPFKYRVILIALIVVSIYFLYDNETVYGLLFQRFEMRDGHIRGYNRTSSDFDDYFVSFIHSSNLWFGKGAGTSAVVNEGGASYKNLIVDYGVFFFLFYVISWCFYFFRRNFSFQKKTIAFAIMVLILYQRPFIGNWLYVFLMTLFPCCFVDKDYDIPNSKT